MHILSASKFSGYLIRNPSILRHFARVHKYYSDYEGFSPLYCIYFFADAVFVHLRDDWDNDRMLVDNWHILFSKVPHIPTHDVVLQWTKNSQM